MTRYINNINYKCLYDEIKKINLKVDKKYWKKYIFSKITSIKRARTRI